MRGKGRGRASHSETTRWRLKERKIFNSEGMISLLISAHFTLILSEPTAQRRCSDVSHVHTDWGSASLGTIPQRVDSFLFFLQRSQCSIWKWRPELRLTIYRLSSWNLCCFVCENESVVRREMKFTSLLGRWNNSSSCVWSDKKNQV